MKKKFMVWMIIIMLTLLVASALAFADTASEWYGSSSNNVYYQYLNQFGGSDWDGYRWKNYNSYNVQVDYQLNSGAPCAVYLEAGKISTITSLVPGDRIVDGSINIKQIN